MAAPARPRVPLGIALLALAALVARVLFWRATPDAGWAWSALYKGDAPLWLEYAQALRGGRPFELGLPLHPPGMGYLVALLGTDAFTLRLAWTVMGASCVLLAALAVRRSFGTGAALVAGLLCCFSTTLLLLSASPNVETPYLVLVLATLLLFEDVRAARRPAVLGWAALHGAACLLRVEHALYFGLLLMFMAALWGRAAAASRVTGNVALAVSAFLLPLVPWHVHSWGAIARFNTVEQQRPPHEENALAYVERGTRGLAWTADAVAARAALPAFARRTSAAFVAATVTWRGGTEVRAADFAALDEAFGRRPRALSAHPFVSLYGPLNFALANHPGARGGFDRAALDVPPPLSGGPDEFPPMLIAGLPPPGLSFDYPPHVRLVNEGYALGVSWIRADPARWLTLVGRKLGRFGSGASLELTGFAVPGGFGPVRPAVDLAVPHGVMVWQTAVLLGCVIGALRARRSAALYPWLLFALSKVVVAVLFFGYVRQGATVAPVAALLVALALTRRVTEDERAVPDAAVAALLLAGLVVETVRWARPPVIRLDGAPIGVVENVAADVHRDHDLDVRWRP